jgi:flavin reductase (DIM6/NTAB) family NADH-FMN oxidoreductase RutF
MDMCSFTVTVTKTDPCATDATKPVLSACPANIAKTTTTTCATTTWTAPTATDNCSTPSVSFTTSPTTGLTNGGCFPIGTTTVTYTAKDAKNNTSTCSFTVAVTKLDPCATDATKPVLSACPANIAKTTTATCATTTWTAPTATDNCSTPSVNFTTSPTAYLTNGGCFPIGTTTVTYKATDAKNNTSTCSFTVAVTKIDPCANDLTAPVFKNCPTSITASMGLLSVCKSVYWTAPTATDNCGTATVYQSGGWGNGSCFFAGTQTITYTAYDKKNNKSYCSFKLNVYKTLFPLFSANQQSIVMEAYAEPNRALIEWVSDIKNDKMDYFTVQKLNNATQIFEFCASINNTNSQDSIGHFVHYDEAPTTGDNFYKVTAFLNDGTKKESAVKKVTFGKMETVLVFPNPATSELNIDLMAYKGNATDIFMYNSLGQLVQTKHIDAVSSMLITMDVSEMVVGEYMMRIVSKGKRDVLKPVSIAK